MGVTFVQHAINDAPDAVRVANHLIVPEAQDAITLFFDNCAPLSINLRAVLPPSTSITSLARWLAKSAMK